jgi:hypothetical protein
LIISPFLRAAAAEYAIFSLFIIFAAADFQPLDADTPLSRVFVDFR